jgi:putative FmdB family regulatory protein
MPTYDYECDACSHTFELFQTITEAHKKKCPACGKLKLRRLFGSGAAVVFKGSGFYQTDYRSESYKKGAERAKKAKDAKTEKKGSEAGKSASSSAANSDKNRAKNKDS